MPCTGYADPDSAPCNGIENLRFIWESTLYDVVRPSGPLERCTLSYMHFTAANGAKIFCMP
jgi:hypothetical protein